MNRFDKSSLEDIIHQLNELDLITREFMNLKPTLMLKEDHYLRELFLEVFSLANRFSEFYKKNKSRISQERIDMFIINNLNQISSSGWAYSKLLGEEKHSTIDYSLFEPWENFYAQCRDYCNTLSLLGEIAEQLEKRYIYNGLPIERKEHIAKEFLKWGIGRVPFLSKLVHQF
jgi:hypothetical protein